MTLFKEMYSGCGDDRIVVVECCVRDKNTSVMFND